MLKIFLFFVVCLSATGATFYSNNLYKDLWECDKFEPCRSFVDVHMMKVINRLRNTLNSACTEFHDYAVDYFFSSTNRNLFVEIANAFESELAEFFDNPLKNDESNLDLRELLRKMKSFYDQCKEQPTDLPSSIYAMPEKLLSSPAWKEAVEESERRGKLDWSNLVAELRRFGLNGLFFEEHVAMAINDSRRYVVELRIPRFRTPLVIYPLLKYPVRKVLELENAIEQLRSKFSQDFEPGQLITLGELKAEVPDINWQGYFNTLLRTNVSEALPIQLSQLDYFKDLAVLLDRTDKKAIAYYIYDRLISYSEGLWEPCARYLTQQFSIGASYIFDRFIYKTHQKDEEELQRIFSALKVEFSKKISENKFHWSSEEQNYLQEKLNGMTLNLGYLPENQSSSSYNFYYNDADLTHSDFVSNLWEMFRFNVAREHATLLDTDGHTKSKSDLEPMDALEERSRPYFVRSQNKLIIPFEFMRAPFFSHFFRHSLTAFALAREILDAFGPRNILFDANGNEQEIGKRIARKAAYLEVLKCLRNEDEAFDAERFADTAGLQLVIDTFFHELPETGADANIAVEVEGKNAEVSFSVRELFFLHFAQYFAGLDSSSLGKQGLEERLNVIVANLPEFSEVCNCTGNSGESSKVLKCKIW